MPKDVWFQTTVFTCGPANLMMGIAELDPAYTPSREEEMAIWREANLAAVERLPAGCGAYGLAVAALRRGVLAEIFENNAEDMFIHLAPPGLAESQRMINRIDRDEALRMGCVIAPFTLSAEFIRAQLGDGKKLLALIDQDVDGHWVTIDEIAENGDVTVIDPYKATKEEMKNPIYTDKGRNTFTFADFEKLMQFGPKQANVILALRK